MKTICLIALLVAVAAATRTRTAPDVAAKVAQEAQENIQIHDNFASEEKKDIVKEKQVKADKDLTAIQMSALPAQSFKHNASKSQEPPKEQEMPEECIQGMQQMQKPEFAETAAACEQKGQYPQKAIAALQKADEKGAISLIEELYSKCAKLSDKCAKLVAPQLVVKLRFSGAAVSEECAGEMEKIQKDEKRSKEVQQCEQKEKSAELVLGALNKGDIDGAISSTESGLEKCAGLNETCSYQIAPVIVNGIVMRAMMEQMQPQEEAPMTTVMFAQPMLVIEEPVMVVEEVPADKISPKSGAAKPTAKKASATKSLLAMSMVKAPSSPRMRGASSPALIQEKASHQHPWVSRLIMQFELKKYA